jgi:hypothetical protein
MNELAQLLGELNRPLMSPAELDSDIRKKVGSFLAGRRPDHRRPGIHVTDLSDPCMRRLVLKILKPEVTDPPPPQALSRIFDQGKATHEWWQNRIYGPAQILVGVWKCSICGEIKTGRMPKEPCVNTISVHETLVTRGFSCAAEGEWLYVEPRVEMVLAGVPVTGNADGILDWKSGRAALEMKTKRSELWKTLTKPERPHIFQASIYAPHLGTDRMLISYISKDEWDTKDYMVRVDPAALPWAESQVKLAAELAKENRVDSASKACASATASRALRCGYSKFCFS